MNLRTRSGSDCYVRARLPNLVALLAVPAPPQNVLPWWGILRNHDAVHYLKVRPHVLPVGHVHAHGGVVALGRDGVVTWNGHGDPSTACGDCALGDISAIKEEVGAAFGGA